MRNRVATLLAVLLGLQLLLAWGLHRQPDGLSAAAPRQALFNVSAGTVDELRLASSDTRRVRLLRGEAGWTVQNGAGGLPADGDLVERTLDSLLSLDSAGPVATSEKAHARFRVTAEDFERRITLLGSGKVLASLYLGSAADRGHMHVRLGGDTAVHAAATSAWEFPVGIDHWKARPEPAP